MANASTFFQLIFVNDLPIDSSLSSLRLRRTFNNQQTQGQDTHQEMRYPNVTSLYFATRIAFNAPHGGVPLGQSP